MNEDRHTGAGHPGAPSIDLLWMRSDAVAGTPAAQWLDEAERERAARFRVARARADFLGGRYLARIGLGRAMGVSPASVRFEIEEGGRPRLCAPRPEPELGFSISHGGGIVLCAVGRVPRLGADVEALDRNVNVRSLAPRTLHPVEHRTVSSLPAAEQVAAFLDLWTAKEAYAKSLGEGLAVVMERLQVIARPDGPAGFLRTPETDSCSTAVEDRLWLLRPWIAPGLVVAVVVSAEVCASPQIRVREMTLNYERSN